MKSKPSPKRKPAPKKNTAPPKPPKAPETTGGGGRGEDERAASDMDSGPEKNSAMDETNAETIEDKLERLRSELPEGYYIFGPAAEVIDFSDYQAPEPPPEPVPDPEPAKPEPYPLHRILFEGEQKWANKLEVERTVPLTPMAPGMFGRSWELNDVEIEGIKHNIFSTLSRLCSTALSTENVSARNAAGRVIANVVAEILEDWPEKDTYQTCVSKTICKIKRENDGFKKRWLGELHIKGVKKKRVGIHKDLEKFVSDAEHRLDCLADEVAHAFVGGEAPLAGQEAEVLAKWMASIPGLPEAAKEARGKKYTWDAKIRMTKMAEQAKRADVPTYFRRVFRPALEHGLWHKKASLKGLKFGDYAAVMETMLRTDLLRRRDR